MIPMADNLTAGRVADTYLGWETGSSDADSWKDNLVRICAFTSSVHLVDTKHENNDMSFDLDSFDLDSTATDEVRDRIIRPLSDIARLISTNFGPETAHCTVRESLRRLLWARNQIWHCFVRTDGDDLAVIDTAQIVQHITTIDNTTDASQLITQAISEFVVKINDSLPERVDKQFAYEYLNGARDIFLKSLETADA